MRFLLLCLVALAAAQRDASEVTNDVAASSSSSTLGAQISPPPRVRAPKPAPTHLPFCTRTPTEPVDVSNIPSQDAYFNSAVMCKKDDAQKIELFGYIQSSSCQSLVNARVDVWQEDRGCNMTVYTDENGKFSISTIMPEKEEGKPTINVRVIADNYDHLVTSFFLCTKQDVAKGVSTRRIQLTDGTPMKGRLVVTLKDNNQAASTVAHGSLGSHIFDKVEGVLAHMDIDHDEHSESHSGSDSDSDSDSESSESNSSWWSWGSDSDSDSSSSRKGGRHGKKGKHHHYRAKKAMKAAGIVGFILVVFSIVLSCFACCRLRKERRIRQSMDERLRRLETMIHAQQAAQQVAPRPSIVLPAIQRTDNGETVVEMTPMDAVPVQGTASPKKL